MTGWETAGIILGICVLALAMPGEDALLIPERRDWLALLRRFMPKARQQAEEAGAREADDYVAALRGEPETMTIRQRELPTAMATVPVKQLGPDEAPAPWAPAPWSPPPAPGQNAQARPKQKPKRDAPTIVMEAVRPEIERTLRPYLDALPSYEEKD
jgi:hypothetical protein